MKVILIGYGEMMRSLALGILNSGHEVVGVLRKEFILRNSLQRFIFDYISPSSDYLFIKTYALKEIKAKSVNSKEFRKAIKDLKADVVIVGSWGEKFSIDTLNTIPNGFVNVHPSLLPKYRGPNPYLQVILHNEELTGVTFHLMDVNYDTGSILLQKEVPILPDDTGGSLKLRCCDTVRYEIGFLLNNFKERLINQRSQMEEDATYQAQIMLKESILNFKEYTAEEIIRKIRAFSPWLHCYLPIKNEFFSFEAYRMTNEKINAAPATIVDKTQNSIFIVCRDFSVMEFSNLKINRPFSKYLSKLFWNKFININDRAV